MTAETWAALRCPYCGGRLELVRDLPHRADGGDLDWGVLGCHCCLFPVVEGIPVMHLQPEAVAAREAVEAGDPEAAFRVLVAHADPDRAERFALAARSPDATYAALVELLGPGFEGGYFLYRFSDPSYVVASAVVDAVAGEVLWEGGRAIDLCGGSGHLTRRLFGRSSPAPVVADLYFAKLWLAARFVAPGCEPVCCDANAPLPFARGAFRVALCADAFMFVWTKRQMVSEMMRLTDRDGPNAVLITHAHNELVWSQSHGNALPPAGYSDLFETVEARVFAEGRLLDDVVAGGPLDLSRRDAQDVLERDPALCVVATRTPSVFGPHALGPEGAAAADTAVGRPSSVDRLNPLYEAEPHGETVRLRLRFPSEAYEEEFGHCRRYLPEEVTVDAAVLDEVAAGRRSAGVKRLMKQRVVLEMPERYC